jgi:hypothetical protein
VELGGAEQAEQLSHYCCSENNLGWSLISCLQFERLMRLFICRKKIVVWKWWGLMPCDLLSNPMVAEYTLARLRFNAFRLEDRLSFGYKIPEI